MAEIAGLGFAFGVLGFVVSTIGNTAGFIDRASNAKDSLRSSLHTSKLAQEHLGKWQELWFPGVSLRRSQLPEWLCSLYWSEGKYYEVQDRLELIRSKERHIVGLLRGREDDFENPEDHERWYRAINHVESSCRLGDRAITRPVTITIPERLLLALYKEDILKKAVDSHQRQIIELEEYCELMFYQHRGQLHPTGRRVSQDEVQLALQAEVAAANFERAIARTYERLSHSNYRWALVFTTMEQVPADCRPRDRGRLKIGFLAYDRRHEPHPELDADLVQKKYDYREDHAEDIDPDFAQRLLNAPGERGSFDVCLKQDFHLDIPTSMSQAERRQRQAISRGYRQQRAEVALNIATWVTLMMPSRWVHGLCSCQVRRAVVGRTRDRRVTAFTHRGNLRAWCNDHGYLRELDLALGLILAELAIDQQIGLREDRRGILFDVLEDGRLKPIDLPALLMKVVAQTYGSLYYSRAVRFCLEQAMQPPQYRSISNDIYVRAVVEPLKEYYDFVST